MNIKDKCLFLVFTKYYYEKSWKYCLTPDDNVNHNVHSSRK